MNGEPRADDDDVNEHWTAHHFGSTNWNLHRGKSRKISDNPMKAIVFPDRL